MLWSGIAALSALELGARIALAGAAVGKVCSRIFTLGCGMTALGCDIGTPGCRVSTLDRGIPVLGRGTAALGCGASLGRGGSIRINMDRVGGLLSALAPHSLALNRGVRCGRRVISRE